MIVGVIVGVLVLNFVGSLLGVKLFLVMVEIILLLLRNGGIVFSSFFLFYNMLILDGLSILCLLNVIKLVFYLFSCVGLCGICWVVLMIVIVFILCVCFINFLMGLIVFSILEIVVNVKIFVCLLSKLFSCFNVSWLLFVIGMKWIFVFVFCVSCC